MTETSARALHFHLRNLKAPQSAERSMSIREPALTAERPLLESFYKKIGGWQHSETQMGDPTVVAPMEDELQGNELGVLRENLIPSFLKLTFLSHDGHLNPHKYVTADKYINSNSQLIRFQNIPPIFLAGTNLTKYRYAREDALITH